MEPCNDQVADRSGSGAGMKDKGGTMTVLEHLSELRLRLIISAGAMLLAALICFSEITAIRQLIAAPLEGRYLIYLSPPEALTANLKLSVIAGVVVASPIILYQAIAFIFPAFTRREKNFILAVMAGICFLFSGGVLFAYRVIFPFAIGFFLQFASDTLKPLFTVSDYISFFVSFHVAFGLVFQLPLLAWSLGRIGFISSAFLRRNRKYALLFMLLVAAIITPPDLISQLMMTIPLLILYELGIMAVSLSEKRRVQVSAETGEADNNQRCRDAES